MLVERRFEDMVGGGLWVASLCDRGYHARSSGNHLQ